MKVAIYARISTDDKGQDINLQIDHCTKYCIGHDWEFEVFQDHDSGYSKPSEQRAQFSEMMAKIKIRELDGILVYSMDRFSREDPFKVYETIKTIVKIHKAFFVSITDGVDSQTNVFPIVLSVMSWLANNWSKSHSARVKAGIQRRTAKGLEWGPRPLGKIKRNRLIRMALLEGIGVRAIARDLDISPGTVSKTLSKVRTGKLPLPKDVSKDLLGNNENKIVGDKDKEEQS
jgi:DNA invertase Pin-like site-specific DNA recombinase